MARRRPADAENQPVEDDLPLPPTVDLSNGKSRTSAEKAIRFFRTRPVTSLLLFTAIILAAFISFSLGRRVGSALGDRFLSKASTAHSTATMSTHAADDSLDHQLEPGKHSFAWSENATGADHPDKDDDDDKHDDNADDEKGTLIDGVTDKLSLPAGEGKPVADSAQSQHQAHTTKCLRKYEPGKLGSTKTLCVTDEFFFDMSIGSKPIGRIQIGVFGEVVPKSAANFRALATCTGVFASDTSCYRGDSFHRIVTNFVIQGGSKSTGHSIYGETFKEEQSPDHHSFLQHAEKGVVSWAEYPIGSQFYILTRDEAKYLDGNHVVFGIVTEGLDVLRAIQDAPRTGEEPLSRIAISNCGDAHKEV